jgi:phosphonatase-like hydrolase
MSSIKLVIFDLAGTTVEDRGQVPNAFMAALEENEIAITNEELEKWRGAAKREVLRFFIQQRFGRHDPHNAARIENAYAAFRRRLKRLYSDEGVHVIAGVEETFEWLRQRDIGIALTTGFDREIADVILRATGWHQGVIHASICSDEVTSGRPAPFMIFRAMEATGVTNVRRVIKVGDTALDLQAGMNAGVRGVVGVLTGSQSIEVLGRVKHTHIISSVAELPRLIASEFE